MDRDAFFRKPGTPSVVWAPSLDILKKPDVYFTTSTVHKEPTSVLVNNTPVQLNKAPDQPNKALVTDRDEIKQLNGNSLLEQYDKIMQRYKAALGDADRTETFNEINQEIGEKLHGQILDYKFIQQADKIPLHCMQKFDEYLKKTRGGIVVVSPLNVAYALYLGMNEDLHLDQFGPREITVIEPIEKAHSFIVDNVNTQNYVFFDRITVDDNSSVVYINDEYIPNSGLTNVLYSIEKMKNDASGQKFVCFVSHTQLGNIRDIIPLIKRLNREQFESLLTLINADEGVRDDLTQEYDALTGVTGGAVDFESNVMQLETQIKDLEDLRSMLGFDLDKSNIVTKIIDIDARIQFKDKVYKIDLDDQGRYSDGDTIEIGDKFVMLNNRSRTGKRPPFFKKDIFTVTGEINVNNRLPYIRDSTGKSNTTPALHAVIKVVEDRGVNPLPADEEDEEEEPIVSASELISDAIGGLKKPALLSTTFGVSDIVDLGECKEAGYSGYMYVFVI